jgi:hypothetical protein
MSQYLRLAAALSVAIVWLADGTSTLRLPGF